MGAVRWIFSQFGLQSIPECLVHDITHLLLNAAQNNHCGVTIQVNHHHIHKLIKVEKDKDKKRRLSLYNEWKHILNTPTKTTTTKTNKHNNKNNFVNYYYVQKPEQLIKKTTTLSSMSGAINFQSKAGWKQINKNNKQTNKKPTKSKYFLQDLTYSLLTDKHTNKIPSMFNLSIFDCIFFK